MEIAEAEMTSPQQQEWVHNLSNHCSLQVGAAVTATPPHAGVCESWKPQKELTQDETHAGVKSQELPRKWEGNIIYFADCFLTLPINIH